MRPHLALFAALLFASCSKRSEPMPPTVRPETRVDRGPLILSPDPLPDDGPWLELALSDGDATAADPPPIPRADTRPLSAADLDALLARLDPLPDHRPPDAFFRPDTTPPPRPSEDVALPFPPPPDDAAAPDSPPAGPLVITRVTPDGDAPILPRLTVAFNQPIVPLTTHAEAVAQVPVSLDPMPPGATWRAIGTRTLVLEPEGARLPMATAYTLTLSEGQTTPTGATARATQTFAVTTPPVSVLQHLPARSPTSLQPVLALTFDQRVDRDAIRDHLQLRAAGQTFPIRHATPEEIGADPHARRLVDRAAEDRWVALVPAAPLPTSTEVTLTLPPGAPSAEGPRTTSEAQRWGFTTHGPLVAGELTCGWSPRERCRPGQPWRWAWANPLDPDQDLDAQVTVEPAIPDLRLSLHGDRILLSGATEADTRYTVTVHGDLRDGFGQTLGAPATATLRVGPADPAFPQLLGPGRSIVVPDPRQAPAVTVQARGLDAVRVRVHQLAVGDLAAWQRPPRWDHGQTPALVGNPVLDETRPLHDPESWTPVTVDLSPFDGPEIIALGVQVESPPRTPRDRVRHHRFLVVPTTLALSALHDSDSLSVWVTDLRTGQGAAHADVVIRPPDGPERPLGRTDAHGLWRGPLPEPGLLLARHQGDLAWMTPTGGFDFSRGWGLPAPGTHTVLHVFDDRHLYRPGETVHVKGWVRRLDLGKGGDLLPAAELSGTLDWTLHDAQHVILGDGQVTVDAHGGFDLDIALPDTPNLGTARLSLRGMGGGATHTFDIREFRRPTFEVTTSVETEGPFVIGHTPVVSTTAAYLAGGGLGGADVRWEVRARSTAWRPAGWDRFRFGPDVSWWWRHHDQGPVHHDTFTGTTDASGTHRLGLGLRALREPRTLSVSAQATVFDVDRQAFTDTATLLVHPASRTVGVRPHQPFFERDEPVFVDLVVTDLDGRALPEVPITAALVFDEVRWERGAWVTREKHRVPCPLTSAAEPVPCRFDPPQGGAWRVEATVTDEHGRTWRAADRVWVAGGDPLPRAEGVEIQQAVLTPDAEQYAPGDTARVLVAAPFAPADARVTWRRAGVVHTETRRLETASTTVEVPIEAGMTPDLMVEISLSGQVDGPDGRPRPAFAQGRATLAIPPTFRALDVQVQPDAPLVAPGQTTEVEVQVRHDGRPVAGAQVALVVVDEAVLALTDTRITDPLPTFHPSRGDRSREAASWSWVVLDRPTPALDEEASLDEVRFESAAGAMAAEARAPMLKRSAAAPPPGAPPSSPPIALRTDFRANALWLPAATTDARGRVRVPVSLPDSLTRYRITAVAVDDQRSGLGEATLTARLPLQVRPSLPRFLNLGDTAELPFVVHNHTDRPQRVDLEARAHGLTLERAGLRFTVPPHDRVEVRLPATADHPGPAPLQVAVAARDLSDAQQATLPVLTPATREGFATYGELSGPEGVAAIRQGLALPDDVHPGFGGLDVTTSTTRLSALTDAVLHLHEHPYTSAETAASRLLSFAALRDVLDAFQADGLPRPEALAQQVQHDLDALIALQNPDGGWPWWQRGRPTSAFLTLHVAHALWRAHEAGFDVPGPLLERALTAAGRAERWLPPSAGPPTRHFVRAHGIYLHELAGRQPTAEARTLWREAGADLPLEALGWLLPTLERAGMDAAVTQIRQHLLQRLTETARTAAFTTTWSDDDAALILHGDRRLDAILLETWLRLWPDDEALTGKLVEGILGARRRGHWGSSQENAWVLVALQRYFREREAEAPDLIGRAWVGDQVVATHEVRGRSTEQASVRVPLPWLAQQPDADRLTVAREGAGRLYWRLGLRYAPRDLALPPAEHGFSVARRYEAVDDPEDVVQHGDGTWHIRAGARVRVTLWMTAPSRRYHALLVDPLPAGLEVIDTALKGTEALPDGERPDPWSHRGWWWGPWYEHENLRDDRVEAYARSVWPGVHRYTYVARATTPGRYVAMPARAEEMYSSETFGRTATERVAISDRPRAGETGGE